MKTPRISSQRGFTLMELMVAMAITTIIVTSLVSITSVALDTWNRSRAELRASRQARSMLDIMARDFEALIVRKGPTSQWLAAVTPPDVGPSGAAGLRSTNASKLMFFTAATDRYEGKVSTPSDNGGDVSCVVYDLAYKNPVDASSSQFETFVMNRLIIDPDDTFRDILGQPNLLTTLTTRPTPGPGQPKKSPKTLAYSSQLEHPTSFICENIFQYTVTFHVQTTVAGTPAKLKIVPVVLGHSAESFTIGDSKIISNLSGNLATPAELEAGRLVSVEISVTVLSDFGVEQGKTRTFSSPAAKGKFFAQNSFEYSRTVQVPSL